MTIGLLPITGLPLPLMSYGGSFMISTLVASVLFKVFTSAAESDKRTHYVKKIKNLNSTDRHKKDHHQY